MDKIQLRKYVKIIRKTLDIENISKSIIKNIRDNILYKNSENVMIFYPLKNEINLLDLLDDNKNL